MTTPLHDIDVGEPPVLLQKNRGFGWVGLLAGLVMIAGVSGLLWMNYDRLIAASSPKSATAEMTEAAPAEAEPSPTLADFQALQQQTTQAWQSTSQLVESQNAELKRLTDQVAALTARIDQLQQPPVAAAPAARVEPSRPNTAVAAPRPAAVARPAAVPNTPRKQPAARPSSTISLGGAPLPGAPPPNR